MTGEQAGEQATDESARTTPDPGTPHARVSRWDRPPPPKDWRYFVNRTGRVLIATGLLMFGFVAYQLWGTGIETARAQNRLERQFEDALENLGATTVPATPPTEPTTTVAVTPTSAPGTTPTTSAPATTAPPTTAPATTEPATTLPIVAGRALAKLEIPKIGKVGDTALYVLPGVDSKTLHDGPGHFPDTPLPGQLGNSALAGHRTTSGAPFSDIDQLQPGDEIIVTMIDGDRFVYEVRDTIIVNPDDYWVVGTDDPTVAELTLTSCHPKFTSNKRIAVRAFLKPAESAPVSKPTFYDLEGNDDGRDPSSSVTTAGGSSVPGTLPGDDETTTAVDTVTDSGTAADLPAPDGLTSGWFQDIDAIPHLIAWAAAWATIVIAANGLSRRFRSYLVGWALAAVPFLISLYFVYVNVARMLPAGL